MDPKPESSASKYIIGIVVIAIIIVGVSLMGKKSETRKESVESNESITKEMSAKTPEAEMTKTPKTISIEYTDANGFTPESVTINTSDTVKFINKSSGKMWVGVDEHPTHTEYDGTTLREHCATKPSASFDQCGAGAEYSFTFTKTGSWEYHNHSRASMRGKISVK